MNYFTKRSVIHPEDREDVAYWTRKWGVNVRQINDAILETGSLKLEDIKTVLRKKGALGSLAYWINKQLRHLLAFH